MSESDDAAARRADHVRALQEERDGYARVGMPDRVAEVDAELARFEGRPLGRSEVPPDDPKPTGSAARDRATRKPAK